MVIIIDNLQTLSEHNRIRISRMLIALFDLWNLSIREQLGLLGIRKTNRSLLRRYRQGKPLANDRDKLERAAILLSIHKSLHLLFPHHRELAYSWMKTPNCAFKESPPVNLIDELGIMGLYIVQRHLDRQIGR